jgi:copper(I)-binding protein
MFMNVTHDIYPGEAVALTLSFADADGETFDVTVGALATDFPPEDDTLIAANASAQVSDTVIDVSLILDNRGDEADTLTSVTSAPDANAELIDAMDADSAPLASLDIPAQAQTAFDADSAIIRLTDLELTAGDVFPITLTFASGKTLTIAVPIVGDGS